MFTGRPISFTFCTTLYKHPGNKHPSETDPMLYYYLKLIITQKESK